MGKNTKRKKQNGVANVETIVVDISELDNNNSIIIRDKSKIIRLVNASEKLNDNASGSKKEKVNWGRELVTAVFTSAIILILSTIILLVAYYNSPGEYKGDKLNHYFSRCIENSIGDDITFEIDFVLDSKDDTVVVCGNYVSNSTGFELGNIVCIFERKYKNFLNVLFGTDPGYKISTLLDYKEKNPELAGMQFLSCNYDNIDDELDEEIVVQYIYTYANHVSEIVMLIQKQDSGWTPLVSDFSFLDDELMNQGVDAILLYDEYEFIDLITSKRYAIHGLSYDGFVTLETNPLYGGYDLLYFITANNKKVGMLLSNSCVLVMERINGGVYRDPNWNGGQPMYFEDRDMVDFESVVSAHWGFQYDGITFYGPDVP